MPVVGGADDDGVDVFAGEDLVVVAGGEDVVAPELLAVREAAVVAVGHGDQLDAGNLHGESGVTLALAAGADERDLDVIVGGYGSGRLGLQCGKRILPPSIVVAEAAPAAFMKLLRLSSCMFVPPHFADSKDTRFNGELA